MPSSVVQRAYAVLSDAGMPGWQAYATIAHTDALPYSGLAAWEDLDVSWLAEVASIAASGFKCSRPSGNRTIGDDHGDGSSSGRRCPA